MKTNHLRLVEKAQAGVIPGLRFDSVRFAELTSETFQSDVVSDYQISQQQGKYIPYSATGEPSIAATKLDDADARIAQFPGSLFFWEHELSSIPLARNGLELVQATLNYPEILHDGFNSILSISPDFQFTYNTQQFAAELAEIRLVVSERFITLENGEKIFLVATTEKPVLYLSALLTNIDQPSADVFQHQTPLQHRGKLQEYQFTDKVQQVIPLTFKGYKVASMTVLEHFHSYFMQRPVVGASDAIWVPAMPPLSWGWSIRVAPIIHNEWSIVRRKLMLPLVSEEGTHFPVWSSNIRNNCTAAKFAVFAIGGAY